ncbi:FAD-dependent oxidoreductase [Frankia sp. AiPs1]|uniref:FAD-dependent oxidoreductase n=1 Tax=Frankia sp. AiPs1 TaxID=573493 RepID=UPI0020449BBC|nr:FAD-dependent oxidoreductase [Frankia sp. AiPs1]MCM3923155.1 FAD-dependent oxidoreductase [Frankia sp. AiPs1]
MSGRGRSRREMLLLGLGAAGALALAGCGDDHTDSRAGYLGPIDPGQAPRTDADLCVYGATPAGVAAAVQARRMGLRTTLLAFDDEIGGMMSGGLSATDVGYTSTIGGFAKEIFAAIGEHYRSTGPVYNFEPHVARDVFVAVLKKAGVRVLTRQRLAEVVLSGNRIRWINTDGGGTHRASAFVDASYEGDLLAAARVAFVTGREANSEYGETLNGVQNRPAGSTFRACFSPYRRDGDPTSGLLPDVSANGLGATGQRSPLGMDFCFRLCLAHAGSNARPFPKPAGYDPERYELHRRYLAAGNRNVMSFLVELPGRKYDLNNSGPVSTNLVGGSANWATADYARREQIYQDHLGYQQGLLWFLANDAGVPAWQRTQARSLGLAADEFVDSDNWPRQLYVREARRMVSDYVATEADASGARHCPDPIAYASYKVDSHAVQRVVANNCLVNEGGVDVPVPGPWAVSLRSILPRRQECANLVVPVCVSSSHVAWSSLRMEPVLMMLGQVAAIAAGTGIRQGVAVQDIAYPEIRAALQRLRMPLPAVAAG